MKWVYLIIFCSTALLNSVLIAREITGNEVKVLASGPSELMYFEGFGKYLRLRGELAERMFNEMTKVPLTSAPGSNVPIKAGTHLTCGYQFDASGTKQYFCWFNMVTIEEGIVYTYKPKP
ncbi:MAG: hypothetical protein HY537_17215 [Deltaproteobacteria bacterium]|nr:hypothetical protein [Deltaproteobacteria bacterium]